jgi:hypothetical protein
VRRECVEEFSSRARVAVSVVEERGSIVSAGICAGLNFSVPL